jgi:hypothetical protein
MALWARVLAHSGPFKLLGLMHGHWEIRESDINNPLIQHDRKHGVNLGIAIVTPASKILDILNEPALQTIRALKDAGLRVKRVPPSGT